MRKKLFILSGLLLLQSSSQILAGDLGINVILSGQVAPGVYGQVELGNTPRPRVVYEQPVVIVTDHQHVRAEPIYLHVPPGHAKNWSKHCSAYNACGRKVYFVKSEEYEPEYHHRDSHHDAGHKGKDKHHGKKHDKHK